MKSRPPYCFVKFANLEDAEKFVALNEEVKMDGDSKPLKINFKMRRAKNVQQDDKDCWFCYDNESIDRDLIVWA